MAGDRAQWTDSSAGRKLNNVADLRASVPTVRPSRASSLRGDHPVELSGVFEGIGDNSVFDISFEPRYVG